MMMKWQFFMSKIFPLHWPFRRARAFASILLFYHHQLGAKFRGYKAKHVSPANKASFFSDCDFRYSYMHIFPIFAFFAFHPLSDCLFRYRSYTSTILLDFDVSSFSYKSTWAGWLQSLNRNLRSFNGFLTNFANKPLIFQLCL